MLLRTLTLAAPAIALVMICATGMAQAQGKPNILVIWGDDIGITNVSAYSRGLIE